MFSLQQQHQPERYVGPSAYDPSRDLSPNLPVDNKSSMGDVEHYPSNLTTNNLTPNNGTTNNSCSNTNNNNNSCGVSSCNYRQGPTTSNFEVGHQTDCLGYGARRNPSPVPFNRYEQKAAYPLRPSSPSLISQFDNSGTKLNHVQSNKQQQQSSPTYPFKSPSPSCFKLKKPSSPTPCPFNSTNLKDFKPNFEFGKFNNNNNNNNTSNNNKNNNDGQCPGEFQNFQPKVEQLATPSTPPTPLSTSEESTECAGCGRRISDRFYLSAVDRKWHAACLQCCQCHAALDGEITCFTRHGNIYCKKDYYRYVAHEYFFKTQVGNRIRDTTTKKIH
ncbi:hypothetical protein RUM43_003205 [Polyplax serrata]|uniref:LIM zinc-binding domain-containing protein n=1 Tax=Polyplax serrata TaxID=468196 RepID=A0AAN8Q0F0_POLSC